MTVETLTPAEQAAIAASQARMTALDALPPVEFDDGPRDAEEALWADVDRIFSGPTEAEQQVLDTFGGHVPTLAEQIADDAAAYLRDRQEAIDTEAAINWSRAGNRQYAERNRQAAEAFNAQMREGREEADALTEHERAVARRVEQLIVNDEANKGYRAQKAARVSMPDIQSLSEFLDLDIAQEPYVIDRIWPTGGNVLMAAQRKAGKTTMRDNLTRALVDGDPFMDAFTICNRRRVAILDFELSAPMLQAWLRRQCIRNTDAVTVIPMTGRAGSFNILDDAMRTRWARMLNGQGVDVLILDPLRPILHALGLNEWNETGPLLEAFNTLKAEAGIAEGMIIQHHGHHAERAAGDSNLEGWPDALWNLTRDDPTDPRSFRYFDAYGRDVDVDKGLVSMYDGHRLAFAADARAAKDAHTVEALAAWIAEHPGLKADQIEACGIRGVNKNSVRRLLRQAVGEGLIRMEQGEKNAKIYHPAA